MKYCPYCGADIPDGAVSFCAECGKALPAKKEKPEKSTPVKKIIILAVGVLVVIGLCVLMLYFV